MCPCPLLRLRLLLRARLLLCPLLPCMLRLAECRTCRLEHRLRRRTPSAAGPLQHWARPLRGCRARLRLLLLRCCRHRSPRRPPLPVRHQRRLRLFRQFRQQNRAAASPRPPLLPQLLQAPHRSAPPCCRFRRLRSCSRPRPLSGRRLTSRSHHRRCRSSSSPCEPWQLQWVVQQQRPPHPRAPHAPLPRLHCRPPPLRCPLGLQPFQPRPRERRPLAPSTQLARLPLRCSKHALKALPPCTAQLLPLLLLPLLLLPRPPPRCPLPRLPPCCPQPQAPRLSRCVHPHLHPLPRSPLASPRCRRRRCCPGARTRRCSCRRRGRACPR